MVEASYAPSRRRGREFMPCPNCEEQIPKAAKRCRYCSWKGGYRAVVRPTLRHFLLRAVDLNLHRSGATIPCPHCQWAMSAKAKRCPLCLRAPEVTVAEPAQLVRAWLHLRRYWVRRAARNAMVCPQCSIQVPPWAPGCLCCGWERPRGEGKLATMRYAFAELRGEIRERFRPNDDIPAGDICPECDVLVPRADRSCLICGWQPDRKKTIRDAAGFLIEEIQQRGTLEKIPDLHLCEGCHVPMPPNARMCLVCGWAPPVKNPVVRYLRTKKVRKFRRQGPDWRPCPSCRVPLTRHAVKCMACGWENRPARYWGKSPQVVWVGVTVLSVLLYLTFQYFILLAGEGKHGSMAEQEQFEREHYERSTNLQAPPMSP
jgi:hypothetical protein